MECARIAPLHPVFGVEVHGLDTDKILEQDEQITHHCAQELKKLVHKHKVVIVRDQRVLSAEQQVRLSQWFGQVEEAGFEQHPKSPHRLILRVSNDENEGYREFGTSGFHVDGSFMEQPNGFSIYHLVHKPDRGTTAFVDLHGSLSHLPTATQLQWRRMWLVKTFARIRGYRDQPGYVVHPLVYPHPTTGHMTMCISQGKTSRFIQDWGVNIARLYSKDETGKLLSQIDDALAADGNKYQYHHKWTCGDLVITDNLAVGHMALPDTQLPVGDVGLRVMHRTVITGTHRPWVHARTCLEQFSQGCDSAELDMDDVEDENEQLIHDFSSGDSHKMTRLARALKTSSL